MNEDPFVKAALKAAASVLDHPLIVERGAALLYRVIVDNKLEIKIQPKKPMRGQSAFQTDLCVFEKINAETKIPRVVMEFKPGLTTHDILIYSAKAGKHKQIYPYLRYGIVVGREAKVPGKFYTHNEALDFCLAAYSFKGDRLHEILAWLLKEEVESSRLLEKLTFGSKTVQVFRNKIDIREKIGKVT